MQTITAESSRSWIDRFPLKVERYLRRLHACEDRPRVYDLLYCKYPDEGKKLIQNFSLSDNQKKELLIKFLYYEPQITCGLFGDQRKGKDATICKIFDDILLYIANNGLEFPRFVTLGNMRKPKFVNEEDMYFSFKDIPSGTKEKEVWIYSSEIEIVLPSREGSSPENRLFSQLEGTMAQNHQKLFGCCKLASKVDINFIRGMNCKIFKFISPEKLAIENVERENILSNLGKWHLPKNPFDLSEALLVFDNQLFFVHYSLPDWWTDEYSEQFKQIPMDKIKSYIEVVHSNGLSVAQIQIAVAQKFRKKLEKEEIQKIIS